MQRLVMVLAAVALVLQDGSAASLHASVKLQDDNNLDTNVKSKSARNCINIIRKPTHRLTHTAGKVLEVKCDAVGAPAPSVQWFRNDIPIVQYDQEANELVHSSTTSVGRLVSSLLLTKPSDNEEDIYTCLFTSGKKTTKASTIVKTIRSSPDLSERIKLLPFSPRITVHYGMYMDFIGSSIKIPCRVRGHPRPLVEWYDTNGELITDNENMKVLPTGDLTINNLRWEDMGQFTCRTTNEFGSDHKTTFIYPIKAG